MKSTWEEALGPTVDIFKDSTNELLTKTVSKQTNLVEFHLVSFPLLFLTSESWTNEQRWNEKADSRRMTLPHCSHSRRILAHARLGIMCDKTHTHTHQKLLFKVKYYFRVTLFFKFTFFICELITFSSIFSQSLNLPPLQHFHIKLVFIYFCIQTLL